MVVINKKLMDKEDILREMGLLYFEIGIIKTQIETLDELLKLKRKCQEK